MNEPRMKDILEKIAQQSVPENTNLWPRIAAQLDEKRSLMTIIQTRPLAAILVALLILLAMSGVAYALGATLGYIPGIGLVENTGNLRVLAEPVSETRDGVTLTITSVFVYTDHVELIYDVKGIDPSNDGSEPQNAGEELKAFCGPQSSSGEDNLSDGDATLRLPDGTIVKRMFGTEYPQNVFAMKPVYKVSIPSGVDELTMVLGCIPWARLGAVPENWEVPFKLVAVPAGTRVGEPVVEVNATSEPAVTGSAAPDADVAPTETAAQTVPSPQVTLTLEKAVQLNTGTVFYFHLNVEGQDPSLVSIYPRNVYVIDSQGYKFQAMNNGPVSEAPVGATFEYITNARPADGALILVVEDAVAKYAPVDGMPFSFDAGENPQPGQTWDLNQAFNIAGYKVELASVRAVTYSDIEVIPDCWDPQTNAPCRDPYGSQGFDYGYQFTLKIDPSHGLLGGWVDILSDSCGMSDLRPPEPAPQMYYTQLCKDGYPKGNVNVALRGISVLVTNLGQVVWSPDGAAAAAASLPAPITPKVKINLERIIPMDTATVFYFSMDMENNDPSLVSIMPVSAYVLDSQGQKIQLIGNFPWQPFEHRVGSQFEYTSQSKPADGPLTLIVENAVAYYAPLYVDPRQATPDEMSFTFDAGENPQYGQIWDVNKEFEIAGYKLKVTTARAANFEDIKTPQFILGSQGYEYGYDFAVEAESPVKMQVEMDILSEKPVCWLNNATSLVPEGSSTHYIQLCRDEYPKGNVRVTIGELAILVENSWQAAWIPPSTK